MAESVAMAQLAQPSRRFVRFFERELESAVCIGTSHRARKSRKTLGSLHPVPCASGETIPKYAPMGSKAISGENAGQFR